jgi:hypothetical protein
MMEEPTLPDISLSAGRLYACQCGVVWGVDGSENETIARESVMHG